MGFIEETGAAQHWRDSRITTIYEGTTGIQANDLIFRKLMRDGGATAKYVFGEVAATAKALAVSDRPEPEAIARRPGGRAQSLDRGDRMAVSRRKMALPGALTGAVPICTWPSTAGGAAG